MKRIFILTGEPSGDKLAAKVIKELQKTKKDIVPNQKLGWIKLRTFLIHRFTINHISIVYYLN